MGGDFQLRSIMKTAVITSTSYCIILFYLFIYFFITFLFLYLSYFFVYYFIIFYFCSFFFFSLFLYFIHLFYLLAVMLEKSDDEWNIWQCLCWASPICVFYQFGTRPRILDIRLMGHGTHPSSHAKRKKRVKQTKLMFWRGWERDHAGLVYKPQTVNAQCSQMLTEKKPESFRLKGNTDWVTIHVTYSSRADFIVGAEPRSTRPLSHNPWLCAQVELCTTGELWITQRIREMCKLRQGAQRDPKAAGRSPHCRGPALCSQCVWCNPRDIYCSLQHLFKANKTIQRDYIGRNRVRTVTRWSSRSVVREKD